jgi:hypothetical protein
MRSACCEPTLFSFSIGAISRPRFRARQSSSGQCYYAIFAGWEGMSAPFRLQAGREFNGESLYDAVNYLLVSQVKAKEIPLLPLLLQLSSALIAAAMFPRKVQDLVNAFLFAVLGFITFSPFYSPQFVLWILPLVAFSDQRAMLISAIGFSWLTYFYFPNCLRPYQTPPRFGPNAFPSRRGSYYGPAPLDDGPGD